MGNVRYNISPCTPEEASRFVNGIDKSKYLSRGTVSADENSFYDRYMYICDGYRVAVVYDNRGKVLSISAPKDNADELLALFAPNGKQVKRSSLPSHSNGLKSEIDADDRTDNTYSDNNYVNNKSGVRSRVFVTPNENYRPHSAAPQKRNIDNDSVRGVIFSTDEIYPPQRAVKKSAVIITSKGDEMSTDEIFPPQRAFKKERPTESVNDRQENNNKKPAPVQYRRTYSYGTGFVETPYVPQPDKRSNYDNAQSDPQKQKATTAESAQAGAVITAKPVKRTGGVRQTVISFGDEDYDTKPTKVYKPHSGTGVFADISGAGGSSVSAAEPEPQAKPRRGRPPKIKPSPSTVGADVVTVPHAPDVNNGAYVIKNYPSEALNAVLKRLRAESKYKVATEGTEFSGTAQEVKTYSVTDTLGQKVYLRYATNKQTLTLQGKRSDLFGEIQTQVSRDSDYSSALEGYVDASDIGKSRVSDVEKRLINRLPTALHFLSEQSKIDFSYGIHDFEQTKLKLSDYSVLLVPPYRGLERFVFDLQRAEGIKVKMIGQAYDKDESGNYILKTTYQRRIGSVIYSEVMVSLYTEYFSRRNFFAHSDNTDGNASRSITDRAVAKKIFDNLLNVVEYNAKKLKEIGFSMTPVD